MNHDEKASVHILLGFDEPEDVWQNRHALFYGPDAAFQKRIAIETKTTVSQLELLKTALGGLGEWSKPQFDRLIDIALLRLGSNDRISELLKSLSDPAPSGNASFSVQQHVKQWAAAIVDKLNINGQCIDPNVDRWTTAEWRLVTLYHQIGGGEIIEERTPLFLADTSTNSRVARVIWLVARRFPGPRLVTPDWWRLGMIPLGQNLELLEGIHYGFDVVLNSLDQGNQFHVTWWLEEMPGGGGWFDSTSGNCDSANGAAACLALALDAREKAPSSLCLMDPLAGISVRLKPVEGNTAEAVPAGTKLSDRPLLKVEGIQKKFDVAHTAGILTMPMVQTNADEIARTAQNGIQTPVVSTLDQAWQMLLATSALMQSAKQRLCENEPDVFPVNAARTRRVFEKETDAAITRHFAELKRKRT